MISYWKNGIGINEINEFEPGCWVNVVNPSIDEINYLKTKLQIPDEFIVDVLDIDERSRAEFEDGALLTILRVPLFNNNNEVPFITLPLGICITNEAIITICLSETNLIGEILKGDKKNQVNINDKINFLLKLFLFSSKLFLRNLKYINSQISQIETQLRASTKNQELYNLLNMEKCLVYFTTSLKSNEFLLAKLKTTNFYKISTCDPELLEDVEIELKQAIEMSRIYSDIQSGLMDAFASIISNNLNLVLKTLTSITIILMIPTLVSSLFGMNLKNFMEDTSWGFGLVVLISIFLSIISLLVLRKRNFF